MEVLRTDALDFLNVWHGLHAYDVGPALSPVAAMRKLQVVVHEALWPRATDVQSKEPQTKWLNTTQNM